MAAAPDDTKLHAFVGKMLTDLGGGMSVPTVRIGLRLGLFDALEREPATAGELAARAGGLHERYVREWALAQAANGYVDYDPATDRFSLSPTRGKAGTLQLVLNDPAKIAAAGPLQVTADTANLGTATVSGTQVTDATAFAGFSGATVEFIDDAQYTINGAGPYAYSASAPIADAAGGWSITLATQRATICAMPTPSVGCGDHTTNPTATR